VQVTDRWKVKRRDKYGQYHGVQRDNLAAGPIYHPERPTASPLRSDPRDRIEKNGVVSQDREWQVSRRVGVTGTDRPEVDVVDKEAAQTDQDARQQRRSRISPSGRAAGAGDPPASWVMESCSFG